MDGSVLSLCFLSTFAATEPARERASWTTIRGLSLAPLLRGAAWKCSKPLNGVDYSSVLDAQLVFHPSGVVFHWCWWFMRCTLASDHPQFGFQSCVLASIYLSLKARALSGILHVNLLASSLGHIKCWEIDDEYDWLNGTGVLWFSLCWMAASKGEGMRGFPNLIHWKCAGCNYLLTEKFTFQRKK